MPVEDNDSVYSTTLDKRYAVTVRRTGPYHGELTIAEGGQILFRQDVGLSYNAQFGPDVADVADWQDIAINFIDGAKDENQH